MELTFWGVRGSISSGETPQEEERNIRDVLKKFTETQKDNPGREADSLIDEFVETNRNEILSQGCHTISVDIKTPKTQMIIDCGSGMLRLANEIIKDPKALGQGEFHIFLTHFHWDHLMGLPFFTPIYIKNNVINLYAVQEDLERVIKLIFTPPMFPVPYKMLASNIRFHKLEPRKPFQLNELAVTPYELDHPDTCWGFKVTNGTRTLSHCVDTMANRVSDRDLGPDLPLYQDTDLMVFDAQYSFVELLEKSDWGHSSASIGIDIAIKRNIPKVVFIHHDPLARPHKIRTIEKQARSYYKNQRKSFEKRGLKPPEIEIIFGREGLKLTI